MHIQAIDDFLASSPPERYRRTRATRKPTIFKQGGQWFIIRSWESGTYEIRSLDKPPWGV